MTGTNDKVRSLFLSALMVMSVVAMGTAFTAGAVADAGNNDTFSTASFENTPSEAQLDVSDDASDTQTQNVVIDGVYLSGEDDTEEVTIDFSDAIDTDLELNNEPSTDESVHSTTGSLNAEYTEVNDESVVIELSSSGSVDDAQFTTQFDWDVTDADADNGLAHEISATGSNNGEVSASLQYKAVGDYTESIAHDDGDKEVFRGETVQLQSNSVGETIRVYEIDEDDDLVTPRRAVVNTGANSDVINYDTSNLDAGQTYIVVFGSNENNYGDDGVGTGDSNVVAMTVTELDLSAELDSTDVAADETIDVSASASTFNDEVTATLLDSNGDVVENDGEDVADTVSFDGSGEASLSVPSADDADYSTGSYTVEVEHTDTGITTETDTVNVTEAEDGDVSFADDSVFTDEAGDIANVTVEMSNTNEATVTIGNKDQGYYIVYQVTDDSGDGQVSLEFNSYTAGRLNSESDVVSVANGDDDIEFIEQGGDFTDTDEAVGSDTLDPTEYEMNASVGHVEMTSDDYTDADAFGTLSLQPRSTENMQTWVAPKGADLDEYSDDVGNLYDDIGSSITESGAAAYDDGDSPDGDIIVLQLEASGLHGAVENAEDGLQGLVTEDEDSADDIELAIEQTNEEANRSPKTLDFDDNGGISVIEDGENDSYFIAVETSNLDQPPERDLEQGDNFEATFSIEEDNVLNTLDDDESEEVTSEFELVEPDTELVTNTEDDLILIESASGQTVSGQTNYAPGTDLTVRVKSSDSASPFGVRPEATVQTDGTFTTEGADFSDVSPGTNLTLQTRRGGSPIGDEYDGRIGEVPTASVSISNQTTDGSTVTVDSVTTENGGFVAIHLNNASGEVIGNSEYLDSGTQQDVEISLDSALDENATVVAMPHQDTNDNEEYDFGDGDGADGPYTENGSAVTDSATVTIQTTEETDTPTPEPETDTPTPEPETDTPTPDEGDDTPTDDGGDETTTGDGAGFGAVVALVGLLAAALLATRRNN
ncbi:BGTF surface domain-containing protein [Halomicrobium sp. LC1Hm]|uniref:DUF7282 domain-containing protein n=1 Tax=Halomicrobium sp. LC1Hm TaxID=2610902 RepID=UPI001298453B|nr:BGTF surface domain-containing protein [Halomicrobium sp. LC1Hm]QGA82329.1 S-layer protein [Halomicrobium sp. LC1Hm]